MVRKTHPTFSFSFPSLLSPGKRILKWCVERTLHVFPNGAWDRGAQLLAGFLNRKPKTENFSRQSFMGLWPTHKL